MKESNKEFLIDPIKKHGGIHKIANLMKLEYLGRKPRGHYKNVDNIINEILPLSKKLGRFPTRKEFEENGMKNLIPIISREGGSKIIAKKMGYGLKGRGA